jgi:S1-C subfamily serine protease
VKLALLVCFAVFSAIGIAQTPSPTDVFAKARDATWAISVLRYAAKGQVEYAAFVGSGFFVSRHHFITAEHVVNASLLGRKRNLTDRIRIFKNSPYETGYSAFKVVYEDASLDIAILELTLAASDWLTVSIAEPAEGEPVGSYGYPLVEFSNVERATAFALGRLGMVAGYGREGRLRRMLTTLTATEGNSGGPVFLMSTGHVIGVQKAQMTDSAGKDIAGYSVSTPLSAIREELEKRGIVK